MSTDVGIIMKTKFYLLVELVCLQCFDALDWAAGRAFKKLSGGMLELSLIHI